VLLSDNMIDLKRQRIVDIRHPTIFASTIREAAQSGRKRSGDFAHFPFFPFERSDRRALDFRIPRVWPTRI
jgi:hypothetical protein